MKKQLLTLVGFVLSLLTHGQMAKESIQLKKINCVETDLKTGEKLTKTYSFENLQKGLLGLKNVEHRGGVGKDGLLGDGAGIMTNIPFEFFKNYF